VTGWAHFPRSIAAGLRWAALVVGVIVFVTVAQARRDRGQAPHERFARGECADCHADAQDRPTGAPRYHDPPGWDAVHGRDDRAAPARCQGCHAPDSCRACHRRPPETHTAAFVRPAEVGPGARQHALLGRLRPEACATCHVEVVSSCVECHTVDEATRWSEATAPQRARWAPVGGLR